jgi:mono/diheme cytochrome c family protein
VAFEEETVRKHVIALSALLIFGSAASAQQTQKPGDKASSTESAIPPEAAKETNPVKPTPASQAQAKKTYGYDCAMCHGADGDGKGDLAVEMKLNLADFRDPAALKDVTDGEMFYTIKNGRKTGKGEMPAEGDRAKPDEIWNLVIYIRSFAKKEPPAKEKPDTP